MYRAFSIRSELNNALQSNYTKLNQLTKSLMKCSDEHKNKITSFQEKKDIPGLVEWILENPVCAPEVKKWLIQNDCKQTLDTIHASASVNASSKENIEWHKFVKAMAGVDAREGIVEKKLNDLRNLVTEKIESLEVKGAARDEEIKSLKKRSAEQEQQMQKLQEDFDRKMTEITALTEKVSNLEKRLKSANDEKVALEEALRAAREENAERCKIYERLKEAYNAEVMKVKALEEELRAEKEENSENDKMKERLEYYNAQAKKVKALEEELKAEKDLNAQNVKKYKRLEEKYNTQFLKGKSSEGVPNAPNTACDKKYRRLEEVYNAQVKKVQTLEEALIAEKKTNAEKDKKCKLLEEEYNAMVMEVKILEAKASEELAKRSELEKAIEEIRETIGKLQRWSPEFEAMHSSDDAD